MKIGFRRGSYGILETKADEIEATLRQSEAWQKMQELSDEDYKKWRSGTEFVSPQDISP